MNNLYALDVTLRDGGNRINFHFTQEDLLRVLSPLDRSGIEFIEVGYRNGAIRPIPGIGPSGMCAKEYLLQCRALITRANIAVMGHPQNISEADLVELIECGVTLFRICVSKGGVEAALPIIKMGKRLGLTISANIIHASQYSEPNLDEAVDTLVGSSADIVYFADSNGSLHPNKVASMFQKYTTTYPIPFGFHAHDNLGLAQANAISAIDAGARWVDFSLAGFGKGGGNLRAEFFTAYLHSLGIHKYNLSEMFPATNYVRKQFGVDQESLDMDEFIRGISDLGTAEIIKLKQQAKV
jgi:4-hydroxy 2-oxovalerate aldolase